MPGISPDLQSAIRGLIRSRTILGPALLCLALGVGISATMLSLIDVLLFRPPAHIKEAGSLKRVYIVNQYPGVGEIVSSVTSYPTLLDLEGVRSFSAAGGIFFTDVSFGRGSGARKASAALVTPGLLAMLGVKPVRGRLFLDAEGAPGEPGAVALLSHDLWRRGFGGAPDVLGKQIAIGSGLYTIIGVLPSRFTGVDLERPDVWLPMNAADRFLGPKWATSRGSSFLEIVGRLRPEVSEMAAAEEATAVYRAAAEAAGRPRPAARVVLGPLQRARGPEAPSSVRVVTWLTVLSWIVLAISCANVASLLVLRGLDRRRELALRLALGATFGRLSRLMLLESTILAVLGGLGAILVSAFITPLLRRLVLSEAAEAGTVLDLRSLGILIALTLGAALFASLAPALWVRRARLVKEIRAGGSREGARSRLSFALTAGQVALTLVLLAGAGGFARSLYNVFRLDLGLDAARVLVATVDLESEGSPASRTSEIFQQALERARRLPGVERASLAVAVPFSTSFAGLLSVPGVETLPELATGGPYVNAVSEDFFATTGTALRRGRTFTTGDRAGAARVAIVNETMARLLWPGREALGQCLKDGGKDAPCAEVVGVVEDARRAELREQATMQYYIPLGQAPEGFTSRALFVRTADDTGNLSDLVRREVQTVAPNLPYVDVRTLADLMAPQTLPWRMGASVLSLFGLIALTLAVVGLYVVVSHSMAQRTYEIGVRVALGAPRRNLLWLSLRQGLGIAAGGAMLGLALVLLSGRLIEPLFFQVSTNDPNVLAAAALLVMLVSLAATFFTVRRVRRIDPAEILRIQ